MKKKISLLKISAPKKQTNNIFKLYLNQVTNLDSFLSQSKIFIFKENKTILGSITKIDENCFNLSINCLNKNSGNFNSIKLGFYQNLPHTTIRQIIPYIFKYPKTFDDLVFEQVLNNSYSHKVRSECTKNEFQELKRKVKNQRIELQQNAYVKRKTDTQYFDKDYIKQAYEFYEEPNLTTTSPLSAPIQAIKQYFATEADIEEKPDSQLEIGELKGFSMFIPRGTMTLKKYLNHRKFDLNTFFHILKSMTPLWIKGISHCDLHHDNLMVLLDSNNEIETIFPIDFDSYYKDFSFPHKEDIKFIFENLDRDEDIFSYLPYETSKNGIDQKIINISLNEIDLNTFKPHLWLLLNYGCEHQDLIEEKLELIDFIIKSNKILIDELLNILFDNTQFQFFTDQEYIEEFRMNFVQYACQKYIDYKKNPQIIAYQKEIANLYPPENVY